MVLLEEFRVEYQMFQKVVNPELQLWNHLKVHLKLIKGSVVVKRTANIRQNLRQDATTNYTLRITPRNLPWMIAKIRLDLISVANLIHMSWRNVSKRWSLAINSRTKHWIMSWVWRVQNLACPGGANPLKQSLVEAVVVIGVVSFRQDARCL